MPSCSKAKNPRGIEIQFDEASHKYSSIVDGKTLLYTSVTTLVGKYFPPFDPTGIITERCAAKNGVTVEELKAQWKKKGEQSCRNGTRVHEICEDIENGIPTTQLRNSPENEEEQKRFNNAIKMATLIKQRVDILGVEKIVFDERLKLAGTIDLFARSKKTNEYLLIDHKTNASIDNTNIYRKYGLAPIEHIADNNFSHYAIQLNMYQFLLKYAGYIEKTAPFKMFLNHITEDTAKLIELPNMQNEIKDIIIDFLVKN